MAKASVQQIDLEEQVGKTLGKRKTSISILDPAIYISRSRKDFDNRKADNKKINNKGVESEPEWDYLRFRASFTLEVEILGFEHAYAERNSILPLD